jgi:NifU-like protein involved in Fe-S cluster formation
MYNETITYYAKNPVNKWKLEDYDIEFMEENRTCWDDLIVYLKIDNNIIKNWSFNWDTAIITTACASIFWESIILKNIKEILVLNYDYIEELIWIPISKRRKDASVLWLLTTRNAIHQYLNDWKKDTFKDLIK